MKHLFLLSLLLQTLILSSQTTFQNLDFKQLDTGSSTGLKDWNSNKQYLVSPDPDVYHTGDQSIKLVPKEGQTFGAFMQSISVENLPLPAKITLSGWLKRQDVDGFTGLWFQIMDGRNSIGFDNMYKQALNGTADWQYIQTSVILNDPATDIVIGGLLVGKGVVWFDDLAFQMVKYTPSPLPDSLRTYLDEALTIMEKNALFRDSVNWPSIRSSAMVEAGDAKTYADCYPVISAALGKLGDHHSFLQSATEARKWQQAGDSPELLPACSGKMLEDGIAYISMPGFGSGDEKANTIFADQTQALIRQLDEQQPKAWILDLRGNSGGNCWPMLAGIGPLLGEGLCGYFVSPGEKPQAWKYKNGASYNGKQKITKTSKKGYKLTEKMPKLAVLTSPQTASSGEVVTIAFRGRPNCRSFGEPTYGVSTGNANYALRDGAQIFLTSSVYADRNMNRYGQKVAPDEATPADQALQAAQTWLKK